MGRLRLRLDHEVGALAQTARAPGASVLYDVGRMAPHPLVARLSGWSLVRQCALLLFFLAFLRLGALGFGEEGMRAMIRSTAQLSVILFSAAFTASSLYTLEPRRAWVRWLRANRRYLGVSFALSHAAHLAFIVALAALSPELVDTLNAATIVGGGLAYVLLFAMAATSFDRSAAWLGRRRWKVLHKVGGYSIWLIFFQSYLPRAIESPAYVPFASLLIAVVILRVWAWRRRNRLGRGTTGTERARSSA